MIIKYLDGSYFISDDENIDFDKMLNIAVINNERINLDNKIVSGGNNQIGNEVIRGTYII